MSLKQRRRTRKRYDMPEVSLTPLIDTALTLLVIFMVTAPVITNNVKINLPQGSLKQDQQLQDYVVMVSSDAHVYFNNEQVDLERIGATVIGHMGHKADLPVYLKADESISYGTFMNVFQNLKKAGVRYVAMATRDVPLST
jgi:biopolymer transport protein ExbD